MFPSSLHRSDKSGRGTWSPSLSDNRPDGRTGRVSSRQIYEKYGKDGCFLLKPVYFFSRFRPPNYFRNPGPGGDDLRPQSRNNVARSSASICISCVCYIAAGSGSDISCSFFLRQSRTVEFPSGRLVFSSTVGSGGCAGAGRIETDGWRLRRSGFGRRDSAGRFRYGDCRDARATGTAVWFSGRRCYICREF